MSGQCLRRVRKPEEIRDCFLGYLAGGGEHSKRAANYCKFIRENVSKHVFRYHNVKLIGIPNQLRRRVVHVHVGEFDGGIKPSYGLANDLSPENGGFEYVGFVDRANPPIP